MKEDEALTAVQVRGRERRKKLLLWQGVERQKVDRFVLVRVGEVSKEKREDEIKYHPQR